MFFALSLLVLGQTSLKLDATSKDLDPKTRPYIELPIFKKLPCVSVSEYKSEATKGKPFVYTRVYRFTFKGNVNDVANRLKTELTAKDGWKVDDSDPKQFFIERNVGNNPHVSFTAIMLSPGKAAFDPKVKSHTRFDPVAGWVRISYNERLIGAKW